MSLVKTATAAGREPPSPAADAATERRLLFISHANPQDNAVAAWFATHLTLLGYEVWCDLKDTAAGESSFWLKVQKKIESEAAKFIFVLSNVSRDFEKKKGIYKEVQAAENLRRDNFILPLCIEKLTGPVPIIIGPDLYIDCENWAVGLRELVKRLVKDGVPKQQRPDLSRVLTWWPAIGARTALLRKERTEIVSNILPFESLPTFVHALKVSADGNQIAGRDQLKGALPVFPPYSAHGAHAISFACANDYLELTHGFDITDYQIIRTADFLSSGSPQLAIVPQIAHNMVTYLVAASLEKFLAEKKLSSKAVGLSRRKIWYAPRGLIGRNNTQGLAEPGQQRKSAVWFVNEISYFTKRYVWHFGVQPTVDMRIHKGIVLTPKAIITKPYRAEHGEKPIPLDEKRVLKKLGWWNNDWRRKVLAFAAWLADDGPSLRVRAGYQDIVIRAAPEIFEADTAYAAMSDDKVVTEILDLTNASIDPA